MEFKIYRDPECFRNITARLIESNEIENNLMIRNIERAVDSGDSSQFLMAVTVGADGEPLLAVTKSPGFGAIICGTGGETAVRCLSEGLAAIGINQIKGEPELVKTCADAYAKASGKTHSLTEELILYTLSEVSSVNLPKGVFRKAREEDMPFLPYWCADFAPACKMGNYNLDDGTEIAKRIISKGSGYIWEDGVMPVSLANNARKVSSAQFIANVYTPPYFCNKGYASACVSHLAQTILDSGLTAALYADKSNPVSNRLYQKIGFKQFTCFNTHTFYES